MLQEGASCGPSLRKKLIDAARRLSKSALSLQVRAGRRDPIALGIKNRDPITVVALVVKCKLVSVIAMCAGCHRDAHEKTRKQQLNQALPYGIAVRAEHNWNGVRCCHSSTYCLEPTCRSNDIHTAGDKLIG